ncbi:MAG: hypothetical protein K0R11_1492, partial [Acidimicrobiales bacterium]|nr:hypothetical protein [Acidimicrobiales bacterium]
DLAKFAVVVAVTAAAVEGGRLVGRRLPATGAVLTHLGAFLVPVDVAAVGVHLELDVPAMLIAEGAAGALAFTGLGRRLRSPVLRWAALAAVVVLVAGVGGATSLPTAVLLAAVAGIASLARRRTAAVAWAVVAGFAPLLTAVEALVPGRSLLEPLGLAGTAAQAGAALAGVLVAVVLGTEAARRASPGLAGVGIVAALVGVGTTWFASDPSLDATVVGLAALFLLAELAAWAVADDGFWGPAADATAIAGEVVALTGVAVAAGWILAAPVLEGHVHRATASALALLAAGWAVAAGRRRHSPAGPLSLAVACLVAAIAAGTGSTTATVAALLVVAGAGAAWGAPGATPVVALAATWAPVAAVRMPGLALVAGAVSLTALLVTTVRTAHRPAPSGTWAPLLALLAVVVGLGTPVRQVVALGSAGALALAVGAGAVVVVVLDLADRTMGNLARVPVLLLSFGVLALEPGPGAAVAGLLLALALADAVRLDEPALAGTAAALVPLVALELAVTLELDTASTGLFLCMAAVPVTGVAATVTRRWAPPALATALVLLAIGTAVSVVDPAALGTALLIGGGLTLGGGLLERRAEVALVGGALLTAGVEAHLVAAEVGLVEAYVAPVAVLLLVLGRWAGGSSWVTDAPAVGLLGGTALLERLLGGGGGHAVLAGAVGVLAVAAGGWGRRSAPLLLGTGVLAVLTVTETLAWTAGVPTWAWLGVAGSALLAAGIGLERAGTSPVEAGQRVVDVLSTRFS